MATRRNHPCGPLILLTMLFAAADVRAGEDSAARTAAAHELPGPGELAPAPNTKKSWCGWQAFLVDAAWMGVSAGLAKAGSLPGGAIGMAGYIAGVPILRSIHGDGGGWSLLRRFTFPLAGGLLGLGIGSLAERGNHSNDCSEGCATMWLGVIGGSAGMVVAMGYDWITVREPAPAETTSAPTWTPTIVATPRMRGVAVALRF